MPSARSVFVLVAAAGFPAAFGLAAAVPEPHPLITEVLAAVPSGAKGDANADGTRDALGDEFVELVNPHARPINLKGYVLVDAEAYNPGAAKPDGAKPDAGKPSGRTPRPRGNGPDASQSPSSPDAGQPAGGSPSTPASTPRRGELRFTFPDLELKPGEVVVVFNGYKQQMSGPVGTASRAAAQRHDRFHNAWVFTMANESPYAALGNEADMVVLLSPDGTPVQCIRWGKNDKNAPSAAALIEEAPVSRGSVQRDGVAGKLVAHADLKGDLAGTPCSPGLFSLTPGAGATAAKPADPPGKPNSGKPAGQPRKPEGGKRSS